MADPRSASEGPTDFGYRLKVPIALTVVALVSGVLVAGTTYALVNRHVESNAEAETRRLAATLARGLVQPVLRNDVWQAYQMVRAAADTSGSADDSAVQVVALDAAGQVFASPSPRVHPLGQHVSKLPDPLAQAARQVLESAPVQPGRVEVATTGELVLALPILGEEESLLGVVLATHPRSLTEAQLEAVIRQLVTLGALAMLVVAVAGGAIGVRMTSPLERLRAVMQALPRRESGADAGLRDELDQVCTRRDEVGELGRTFAAMIEQVAAQQELERHMLEAERMASIGQLSAGIAHEVNNPLGGMLAAIENRRLRGGIDEATTRTLGMLERGLRQVHGTVQALLNEARSERHPLTDADLRDLELLLMPEAAQAAVALRWRAAMPSQDLPAIPVRQVMLNLTLNAIAAAGPGGSVEVWTQETAEHWQVWVGNSGAALDQAKLATLTQGSERSTGGRLGLGLWITARILHTVRGQLRLEPAKPPLATVLVAAFAFDGQGSDRATTDQGRAP